MGNYFVQKQDDGYRGIYLIVNVMNCEAYVGKAHNLAKRTHKYELKKGIEENIKLQNAFNRGDVLIYFTIGYDNNENCCTKDKMLLDYEKLFIYITEQYGKFTLYNGENNPKMGNRTREAVLALPSFRNQPQIIERAREAVDEEFEYFFGPSRTMRRLVESPLERENALKYFMEHKDRLNKRNFYLKKPRLKEYGLKEYGIEELKSKLFLVSTGGSYLKDDIYKILKMEITAIEKYGYCLWVYGKGKINTQFGRKICEYQNKKTGDDIYLLIKHTHSGNYDAAVRLAHFQEKDFLGLCEADQKFLSSSGNMEIQSDMDSTGTQTADHAFVVKELGYLKESFDFEQLKEMCYRITERVSRKYGNKEDAWIGGGYYVEARHSVTGQNDTGCLLLKDGESLTKLKLENNNTTDYIVARLASPYIVDLEQ